SLPIWGDLEGYYAFNAKELDEENNMYYYSARYYAPPTFISRDPMFEKYPFISPYAYCANNPLKYVDPTGEDNVIYLVNLQKGDKIIDPKELITQANQYFKDLGLKTRVALAPKNFDPAKMDKTDSYAAISNDGKQAAAWINKNDPNANKYQIKFDGFGFSGNEPERSSNTFGPGTVGQKTDAIALDAQSISFWAGKLGVSTTEYAALSILHGAGHNVNFNHSAGEPYFARHGEDPYNCGIMVSGNYLLNNKANYNELISKDRNSTYINVMKKDNYFGNNTAKTYWDEIIK
ncbi:MAG TPA: RHS repeat-associated core domain-containing protein, partial [Bacteroidales bacterium]|nr:RHS repeat-associated core domain-containing protein [Bacteroidales bacterium]